MTLRNLFNEARQDSDVFPPLVTDDVEWLATSGKKRELVTPDQIDHLLSKAGESENGEQFTDYIRFLQYTGAREQEAIKVRWADVDLDRGQVTIGADPDDTKNRTGRHVDMSDKLRAPLEAMKRRYAGVTEGLFPSPQRPPDKDVRAKSFRESLNIIRKAAKMPSFGFHDSRHHFISYAVMFGIDYMTNAAWVGHKDGGVLIDKVYGHLANEHRQTMAQKMDFGTPQVVKEAQA